MALELLALSWFILLKPNFFLLAHLPSHVEPGRIAELVQTILQYFKYHLTTSVLLETNSETH